MTQKEIKHRLEVLENTLTKQLEEGNKYGVERGSSFEAGWYIGTIRATISELQILQGKVK